MAQYELDNRDYNTTWLQLPDGDYVEVQITELIENAQENLIYPDVEPALPFLMWAAQYVQDKTLPIHTLYRQYSEYVSDHNMKV